MSFFFFSGQKKVLNPLDTYKEFSMNHIAIHDISNMLYSISIKYNIDLDLLRDRYIPIINIEKKTTRIKRKNKQNEPIFQLTPQLQCNARCWKHDDQGFLVSMHNGKWIYGQQCTHFKYATSSICLFHQKIQHKHGRLLHGLFQDPPPHPHFEKHKKKYHV